MYEHSIKGTKKVIQYSCPLGMTADDVDKLFPDERTRENLGKYMVGQTGAICTGEQYHHIRVHNEYCMAPITPEYSKMFPEAYQHTEESPHDWRCGYDGGWTEPSKCADNPHGTVIYPWDVERFILGLPVID